MIFNSCKGSCDSFDNYLTSSLIEHAPKNKNVKSYLDLIKSDLVENIFNVILCDFRKEHSTQYALFKLLQSWQHELDEKGMVVTVLMDLFNAYGLLITKLLANTLINSRFHHAAMIWIFAIKSSIDKIFKIHKRTLQINYDGYNGLYENLLKRSAIFRYIKNTCNTWLLQVTNPWRS